MTFTAVWRLLRAVPASMYAGGALCAAFVTAWALHVRAVDQAYLRGQQNTMQGAHFDSVMVKTITDARAKTAAHTDTIVKTVQQIVRRVDSVHVPDSVRIAYPVVDTLVVESRALVVAVDSLTRTLATERKATTLLVSTLQQSVTDARLVSARLAAENAALSKRPTRMKALALGLLSAGAGYAAGAR